MKTLLRVFFLYILFLILKIVKIALTQEEIKVNNFN